MTKSTKNFDGRVIIWEHITYLGLLVAFQNWIATPHALLEYFSVGPIFKREPLQIIIFFFFCLRTLTKLTTPMDSEFPSVALQSMLSLSLD